MKKILALLLIFVLVLGFAACGTGDETPEGTGGNDAASEDIQNEENNEKDEATDAVEPGDKVNPDDITMGEEYSSMEEPFDFDFQTKDNFGLGGIIEKAEYSKLSELPGELENRISSIAKSVFGEEFGVFSDYEEDDTDPLDKLAYAVGMMNDDTESIYMEGGVYHSQTDDKHYQYIMCASETFEEVNDANIQTAVKTLEDGMGIKISAQKMKEAVESAYATAVETEDFYSLLDSAVINANGYRETVKVSCDAVAYEDGTYAFYVSAERERCYE